MGAILANLMVHWLVDVRREKMVEGRVNKLVKEKALLEQAFIKDTSKTVSEVVKETSAAIGEKVSIRRFRR